jgi:hypothetical protein
MDHVITLERNDSAQYCLTVNGRVVLITRDALVARYYMRTAAQELEHVSSDTHYVIPIPASLHTAPPRRV